MSGETVVSGIDFSGDTFVVRAGFFGTTYSVLAASGTELLRAKRDRSKNKTKYTYYDPEKVRTFRMNGGEWGKRSKEFTLVSTGSETALAQLTRADPDSQYGWELTTPPSDAVHAVISRDTSESLLDTSGWDVPILSPLSMTATNDGEQVAVVDGRPFATRVTFDLTVTGLSGVPKKTLILAVPVLYETMQPEFWGGG